MGILDESTLSLADACDILPRAKNGKPINFSTIFRWALRGIMATDGTRIKLEAIRLGGRWITSREALERFSARLTPDTDAQTDPIRTPTARRKAAASAKRKLAEIGI